MRRLVFCLGLVGASAGAAIAQAVPGRDLLRFPLGLGAQSPAHGESQGAELWNPAAGVRLDTARAVVGAAALNAPQDLGVSAQLLSARVRVNGTSAVHLSIARAAVTDLVRTETDPESVDDDVPYSTTLVSLGGTRRRRGGITVGSALRYRSGRMDRARRGALGIDAGFVADSILGGRVRAGASTFLWRPGTPRGEGATFVAGADARIWRRAGLGEVRAAYAASATRRAGAEHYGVATLRAHGVEAAAGLLHTRAYGGANTRPRLGVGLHYARYVVGIARDESGAGLGPTYQFMLSTSVP